MNAKTTLRLLQATRQFSRSAACKDQVHPGYNKIKAIQEQFQKPDGLPIHLKGGALDKVLYATTIVACFAGILGFGQVVYDLGFAKKN
ncbi:cytochrome c oxidase subunit 7A, mitochondrial-like [Chironomus tepperi]|uniref:cytochrome c oxidase subunit 7A, mitochondrial-like n=1 Tax=Chironomus tepperi TaxID=113505 RepID=UPI00391F0F9E